jgi:hypothetical protein
MRPGSPSPLVGKNQPFSPVGLLGARVLLLSILFPVAESDNRDQGP